MKEVFYAAEGGEGKYGTVGNMGSLGQLIPIKGDISYWKQES
jgi:hypothetical protein